MMTTIEQCGESLVIPLSHEIASQLHLRRGSKVQVTVAEGKLIITEAPLTRQYTLAELVAGITEENRHDEIEFGGPVGRELI